MHSEQRAERVKAAAQMYVYGYPLVYCLREVVGFAQGHSSLPVSAPWNEFGYARELLGPETTFVSPNNDRHPLRAGRAGPALWPAGFACARHRGALLRAAVC